MIVLGADHILQMVLRQGAQHHMARAFDFARFAMAANSVHVFVKRRYVVDQQCAIVPWRLGTPMAPKLKWKGEKTGA